MTISDNPGLILGNIIIDNQESNRVEVNSYLLDTAREKILEYLKHKYKVSNSALITFALVNLLDNDQFKLDLLNTLSNHQRYTYFNDLNERLQPKGSDTTSTSSSVLNKDLKALAKEVSNIKSLAYTNLVLGSWLTQNRMGLFVDDMPVDTRDAFMLLRSNNTTGIVDEAIKAGAMEESRQAQRQRS